MALPVKQEGLFVFAATAVLSQPGVPLSAFRFLYRPPAPAVYTGYLDKSLF